MPDKDPEELLQQSAEQRRATTEAPAGKEDTATTNDRVEAIANAFEEIDAGASSSNLTLRDEKLAALFRGLSESELTELSVAAQEAIGRDTNPAENSRSDVLRYLIRAALQDVEPDVLEDARSGYEQYLQSQADEF